jgi:hypothetical protein
MYVEIKEYSMQTGSILIYILPLVGMLLVLMQAVAANAELILDALPNKNNMQRIWQGYAFMLLPSILFVGYSSSMLNLFLDELFVYLLFAYGLTVIIGFPLIYFLKKINLNYAPIIILLVTIAVVAVFSLEIYSKHYSTVIALRNWHRGLTAVIIQSISIAFAFCIGAKISFFSKS